VEDVELLTPARAAGLPSSTRSTTRPIPGLSWSCFCTAAGAGEAPRPEVGGGVGRAGRRCDEDDLVGLQFDAPLARTGGAGPLETDAILRRPGRRASGCASARGPAAAAAAAVQAAAATAAATVIHFVRLMASSPAAHVRRDSLQHPISFLAERPPPRPPLAA
jgi:hypothetical protein